MGVKGATAVLIVEGKIALQLRDAAASTYPNSWGLFGGQIEPGESSRNALLREIREELELDVSNAEHLIDYGPVRVFISDVSSQWRYHVLHEGREARLFTFEEALALRLNAATEAAIAAARRVL